MFNVITNSSFQDEELTIGNVLKISGPVEWSEALASDKRGRFLVSISYKASSLSTIAKKLDRFTTEKKIICIQLVFQDFVLDSIKDSNFKRSTTFYEIRQSIGGLSNEIWKTGEPVSSILLAHTRKKGNILFHQNFNK